MEDPAAIWRSVPGVGQNYETAPGQAVEEPPFSAVKRFAQTLEVLFQRAPSDNACLVGWKDNLAGQEERGYRGVTKHKRTRRFEAHIWHDKKQVYLGGFVNDVDAARSHDIMSLWCKGWHVASLNYAAEVYSVLKPFASLLSVADVRSCLRSCSKRQVAKDKASAPAEFGSCRKKIKARSVRARQISPKRYSSNSHRSSQG
ncbi:hypothetical protein H632_c208p0 [Helicosporidium sp. ATCC 50920]|nr:hypothetical protein H632_c208p0 [Helicosporidium sp. ATCC 50920]|eukprot:KDD76490.1 hypothetical protein H632_c208p0 [Helicosporidium sp. ATCC 50920]